ncbi:PIN domain-containing protein [Halobacterium litoreum]|uniref:VapC toxin family PIN domain ribonuclease n=1 Tax=Halobacterium litoreum TaxID=2039234 RepID=A0ABD5NAT7_9EURY|nr:hypothetical protein [Halobacterium litoreum]UHH14777.1 hypothetical protein LT972_07175 [Halobacterium litoreum]
MTLYDSSVLIDYLDGRDDAVAPPLVLYEVFKSGPADFDAVDGALEWLVVLDETPELARAAAELQDDLANSGQALSARDTYIAGSAKGPGERLAASNADFDVPGITDALDVDIV